MEAKQFSIAKSSNGTIGLITSQEKIEHTYKEGTTKKVWTGVILEENTFNGRALDKDILITAKKGGFWSSSNPEVIGEVSPEDILKLQKLIS